MSMMKSLMWCSWTPFSLRGRVWSQTTLKTQQPRSWKCICRTRSVLQTTSKTIKDLPNCVKTTSKANPLNFLQIRMDGTSKLSSFSSWDKWETTTSRIWSRQAATLPSKLKKKSVRYCLDTLSGMFCLSILQRTTHSQISCWENKTFSSNFRKKTCTANQFSTKCLKTKSSLSH